MKHDELRNQYERLKEQMAQLLKQKPQLGKNPELRQLLNGMQVLAEKYDETLTDAEAQIEQLKRELFGPCVFRRS